MGANFANKGEVIDALFDERLQDIAEHATEALAKDDAWRYLAMFLDGIRAYERELTKLPVAALSAEQTHAVITRKPGRKRVAQ